jgi:hypothetical protein
MYQDFAARRPATEGPAAPSPRDEAAALIARYPNLSEGELARLINLYRRFSSLDSALIISDEQLAPKLDRFVADNRAKVKLPFRQYAGLVAYALLAVVAVAWAVAVASS